MSSDAPTIPGASVGPAFDLHDLELVLGAGTTAIVVRGSGADAHVATVAAIDEFRRIQTAEPSSVAGVVALLEAGPGIRLLAAVKAMASVVAESFGEDVHLVTRGSVAADRQLAASPGTSVQLTVAIVPLGTA
ncbi:hypothetical protein [Variovorax sp. LjRoot178]|uniref:hypothetical protein n=1 Tax=Variovorax sp. LjRoot178 TaxID=3342277 RepID=UPI003ECCE6E5